MRSHAKAPSARAVLRRATVEGTGAASGARRSALILAAVTIAVLALAPSALASKSVIDVIYGESAAGTLGGQFDEPRDVAVNRGNGRIFVVDGENERIQRFSTTGSFERAWGKNVVSDGGAGNTPTAGFEICTVAAQCRQGESSGEAGGLNDPQGIALDEDNGWVYVADRGNNRISVFDEDGSFLRAFGYDVAEAGPGDTGAGYEICVGGSDTCKAGTTGANPGQFTGSTERGVAVTPPDGNPATGALYAADPGNRRVLAYNLDGTSPSAIGSSANFGSNQPRKLAVDAGGVIYTSDSNESARINRYSVGEATFLAPIKVPPLLAGPSSSATSGLAVDAAGRLYVLRDPISGETVVQQFDSPGETAAPLAAADTHAEGAGFSSVKGLGVNAASGRLYVAKSSGGRGAFVVDEGVTGALEASLEEADEVGAGTATLKGTVDPNGSRAYYHFEYSQDGVTWVNAPASDADVGLGTGPVPVSAAVTGLQANTLYRVRLRVRRLAGDSYLSGERTFLTDAIGPGAETLTVAARTDVSAKLAARVNPNGSPTTYYFQWGETDGYGRQVPIPASGAGNGGVPILVSQEITGLVPGTTYHYRVVAHSASGTTTGEDSSFRTRAHTAIPQRGWEMITPPLKPTRSVANINFGLGGSGSNPNAAIPSLDGEDVFWGLSTYSIDEDTVNPAGGDRVIYHRGADGWSGRSLLTQPFIPDRRLDLATFNFQALSGNLAVRSVTTNGNVKPTIMANEGTTALRVFTNRDGTGLGGYTGWLRNVDTQAVGDSQDGTALFNDDGSWVARWGAYRGIVDNPQTGAAEDPSVGQLAGEEGGRTVYLQAAPPSGAIDLVSECSGVNGSGSAPAALPTQVPARLGSGVASDTIGTRSCEAGSVTSPRGAVLGAGSGGMANDSTPLAGPAATAMAENGRRVYFMSPDPAATGVPRACADATGPATSCPPQLYVRQYDSAGDPIVRWVSRSRATAVGGGYAGQQIAGQQIASLGSGAAFEGASRDGRVVYFRTDAPLTPDDPNGGASIVTGGAQSSSWDLYRYELPASRDDDPDAGVLTRVSGGPGGAADPGAGSATQPATRFISDDGRFAYFITAAPIAGASAGLPQGGVTEAGSGSNVKNLYLFDAAATGAARYRFIAQLGNGCATRPALPGPTHMPTGSTGQEGHGGCVRGVADGSGLVFLSQSQLTGDDSDSAVDLYVYDAVQNELNRVSAPLPGSPAFQLCMSGTRIENCSTQSQFYYHATLGHSGYVTGADYDLTRGWGGGRYFNVGRDAQGRLFAFFDSRTRLVPEDTNGTHWDVYEWLDGELNLVSSGNTPDHSYYSGESTDGRTVFVWTSKRIDPAEVDDADYDLYAARIGGGFAFTPPETPCDALALGCESEAVSGPASSVARTTTLAGSGNFRPRTCRAGKESRGGRCVTKRKRTRKQCRKLKGAAKRRCVKANRHTRHRLKHRHQKRAPKARHAQGRTK